MPTFELLVVGCGGGPDETNLSSYLLKPCNRDWDDPAGLISLEAGSGLGALNLILKLKPDLLKSSLHGSALSRVYSASQIYSFVRCFVVTHAHLDHVNSLVLSAGSLKGHRKRVYGSRKVLEDLEIIFADRLWPNLASWDEDDPETYKLLYTTIHADSKYKSVHLDVSVRMMPVSHGRNVTVGTYESTAYFIRHDPSGQEFLFFGDVEPDSVSARSTNMQIWRAAAHKIPDKLQSIFIECSWPSGRKDDDLFGHMTPEHLAIEFVALATEVVRARKSQSTTKPSSHARKKRRTNPLPAEALHGALIGVTIYIMHCKEDLDGVYDEPINQTIASQVRALVDCKGLGADVLALEQGTRIFI